MLPESPFLDGEKPVGMRSNYSFHFISKQAFERCIMAWEITKTEYKIWISYPLAVILVALYIRIDR